MRRSVRALLRQVARLEQALHAQRAVAVRAALGAGDALAHLGIAHCLGHQRKAVLGALLAGAGIHSLSGPRVHGTRERRAVDRVEVAGVAQHAAVRISVREAWGCYSGNNLKLNEVNRVFAEWQYNEDVPSCCFADMSLN